VVIEATTKDKIASARVGFQWLDALLDLKVQGPVGAGGESAVLADLNGLRNKSTIEAGFNLLRWGQQDPAVMLTAACDRARAQGLEVKDCSYLNLKRLAGRGGISIASDVKPARTYILGASAKFGREEFVFTPLPSLVKGTQRHASWALSARGGVLTSGAVLIAASYTREHAYAAGPQTQVCSPIDGGVGLTCATRTVAAPSLTDTNIGAVELRTYFGRGFAINPRLSFTKDVMGIEVPLYFLQHPDGGLSGGVSLGWRSDAKAFVVSAFVGQVLALLSR
jgi:hypothetical protein